jgi:hypothetical protein
MRTLVLLPMAAAAFGTAAIGWGLATPRSPVPIFDQWQVPAVVSLRPAASETGEARTSPPMASAALRYRAETCGGDYVCREDGAWESAADTAAEIRTLTSDGF